MTMTREWRLLILLAALAAVVLVASAARFEPEQHSSKELESKDSLGKTNRDREREWWEEEEGEEETGRERERRREREWEEEEEEEERERREEEEREKERAREREEERERQRERERERERERQREEREREREREEEEEREEREREEEEREEREREREREREEEEERGRHGRTNETEPSRFILERPKEVISTEAGSLKVLPRRLEDRLEPLKKLGLGFLTLEPKAMLLPHYLDAPLILYVQKGNARLGWVEKGRYFSTDMIEGDIYTLPGGVVHYILNTDSRLRLNIVSALDARESLNPGHFQPFFVAGGWDPPTVLSGFSSDVLAAAYRVDRETVASILKVQNAGAIIYTIGTEANKSIPGVRRRMLSKTPGGSWWNGWNGMQNLLEAPWNRQAKPFNLLTKKPDFKNDNGWSSTVDKKAFPRLKHADLSMFAVSLKAGSMLAPHWNPKATEISLVTKGKGYVHVAFPNGTKALDARVSEGTVFVVPRYYPVSQVASRDGTFEFVGYSTCSKPNKPQFLAGDNSVLNALFKGAEFDVLAAAFDVGKDILHDFLDAQKDVVILPGYAVNETEAWIHRAAY